MKKIHKSIKKGFTLVELVVVIAVIAILASISVGAYFGITVKAKNSKLSQESADIRILINLIGNEGEEHSTLTNRGLEIYDIDFFIEEFLFMSGGDYNILTNGDNESIYEYDDELPTVNFITSEESGLEEEYQFDFFKYSTPSVTDSYILVHIISGESEVIKGETDSNVQVLDSFKENYEGTGSVVVDFGDVNNKPLADTSGTKIETETFTVSSNKDSKYNIELKDMSHVYNNAGKSYVSALKVGHNEINSKNPGEFTFTVASDVLGVIFYVGDKGNNGCVVEINGYQSNKISSTHINHKIMVSTEKNKTVTFKTVGTENILYQVAYIDKIELILESDI